MATFSLISNIVEDVKTPKKKFQVFEAMVGFERTEVCIPFEKAAEFEEAASTSKPRTVAALRSIAAKFGGEVL